MKMLRNLRLPQLVAAVAAAGLCLSAAYAVPSYTPDVNSPINSPDGGVGLGAALALIDAQLPGIKRLDYLPLDPGPAAGQPAAKPTKAEFIAAVIAAAQASNDVSVRASIVKAALSVGGNPAYGYSVTSDVVRGVLKDYLDDIGGTTYSAAGATAIVQAALEVNNGKSKDVVKGAILAIGDTGTSAQELDSGTIAAGGFDTQSALANDVPTKASALIVGLAETLIKTMKPSGPSAAPTGGFATADLQANINAAATALIDELELQGATFLLNDATEGLVKGARVTLKSSGTGGTLQATYTAIHAATAPDAISQAHAFAGILRTIKITEGDNQTSVKAAFAGPTGAVTDAVFAGYFEVFAIPSNDLPGRIAKVVQLSQATPAQAANFVLGATYLLPAIGAPAIAGAIQYAPDVASKQAMLAGVARAAHTKASKAAGAAVASTTVGGLSTTDALAAALPNVPVLYSGAVVKEITKAAPGATTASIVGDAINALEGAAANRPEDNFKGGIIDVVSEVIKLRGKTDMAAIITAGIGAADAGTGDREAVAAAVGRGNYKVNNSAALATALGADPGAASVLKAEEIARLAKTNTKAALTLAQNELKVAPSSNLGAIVLGAGSVDKKLVNVLIAGALRAGGAGLTSGDKALLLAQAKSVNKTGEADVQLAFDVASLVLNDPDELFDITANMALKNPKSVATVAAAASAAAPGYIHNVARAAAFRAGASQIAKIPAAVLQGGGMNVNLADNPAAVAAVGAAIVLGINDAQHIPATRDKFTAAAVTALVKASMTIGDSGTGFRGVNLATGAAPTAADQPAYQSAGAVTGLTSIATAPTDATPNPLLTLILKAAGKAVGHTAGKSQMTVIGQAAAQAFFFVTGAASPAAINAIALAITNGAFNTTGGLPNTAILAAANAGAAEAALGNYGAGAAGVLNYTVFNFTNSHVTSVINF